MAEVNFFWRGYSFNFLQNIVIKSHIKVSHEPIIWVSGKKPFNKYWKEIEKKITIKNADDVCSVNNFLDSGGNLVTASSFWRFNFLYSHGGLYCDTDAFALRKFPDDEWIVCSAQNNDNILSPGVLRTPENHPIFLECISNVKKEWGNVKVFTDAYRKFFGNLKPSHDNLLFYPYKWNECQKLFQEIEIPKSCYSIHFYTKAINDFFKDKSRIQIPSLTNSSTISEIDECWCDKNPNTLLGKIWYWLSDEI